jgi:hypothetical protein
MLAFDDNAPTHLDVVIPELEKRKLTGMFYVIAGSDRFQEDLQRWKGAAQSPHVKLANHTFTHCGATSLEQLEHELERCNEVLHPLLPGRASPQWLAFGRPGGVPWTVSDDEVKTALDKFHLVLRPRFFHPAKPDKTPEQITSELIAAVDNALETGETTQFGFHGVGGDWHSTPLECFLALLGKLEAHRDELWITDPVSLKQ